MKKYIQIALLLYVSFGYSQEFGQNKVQYEAFDWNYIRSPHFDVYYYKQNSDLAKFTVNASEDAYEQISKHLRWTIKKPISIIVYNSHNDFQQTNVVDSYMYEGIGGVTELFKNRVVLPFEGSYDQFRHVIHHELVHALVNDMMYGGSIQGIITGKIKLRIPLWVSEGLAEYLALNWDTKSDMIIRDMAIHEQMPEVEQLDAYMAYRGGQSVWRYIASTYGREKVGEILLEMKQSQNAEKGFRRALGMDYENLSEKWHKYLKKDYWPDVAGREEVGDIAKQLTDHKEEENFYNISPAISPDGSKIAILSDRSGYADILLIDALDGKLLKKVIKGNRSINFEELKWLQPGISWSPDGQNIVIASKSGDADALYLINIETGKLRKLTFDLDGLFTASWSPSGNYLCFVGNRGNASDIFLYDLKSEALENLTNDLFSDSEPVWSPDGELIAFVSDRGEYIVKSKDEDWNSLNMSEHDYTQRDIYVLDTQTKGMERITSTDHDETYPVWAHTKNILFYTSDDQGIWNIIRHEISSGEVQHITNVLTGIQQLSLSEDDKSLVFSGYNEGGWDIYTLSYPLESQVFDIEPTNYYLNRNEDDSFSDLRLDKSRKRRMEKPSADYSRYIFAPHYEHFNDQLAENDATDFSEDSLRQSGEFVSQKYLPRFTLDFAGGNFSFSNIYGAQGMTYFYWSDILGDYRISFGTDVVISLDNSDFYLAFSNLKKRYDYHLLLYQTAYLWQMGFSSYGSVYGRLKQVAGGGFVTYPFNRFQRFDFGLTGHMFDYKEFWENTNTGEINEDLIAELSAVLPRISWVYDNSVFGYTGPVDGFRQNLSLRFSPGIGKGKLQFNTLTWDARKYIRYGKYYSLAGRIMVGKSMGSDQQQFFLGGLPNWYFGNGETNGIDDSGPSRSPVLDESDNILKNVFFAEYAMPVRGTRYVERQGANVALMNFEYRFPFLFAFGPPKNVMATYLFGHLFYDIGAAWDRQDEFWDKDVLYEKYQDSTVISPTVSGFGTGIKLFTPMGLLRIDIAWDVKNNGGYSKPQYYFSFGADW